MEVIAKLRFVTPCLGNERREQRDLMLRSKDGKVIMLQSWWRCSFAFAAKTLGRFTKEVEQIQADPEIKGSTRIFKRWYNASSYKEHEAFLAGEEIEARFCLPNEIKPDDFKSILETAGKYAGLSPYGYKQDYGRFAVISVAPVTWHREETNARPSSDTSSGSSTPHQAVVPGSVSAILDIQAKAPAGR